MDKLGRLLVCILDDCMRRVFYFSLTLLSVELIIQLPKNGVGPPARTDGYDVTGHNQTAIFH